MTEATLRVAIDPTGAVSGGKRVEKAIDDIRAKTILATEAARVNSSVTAQAFSAMGAVVKTATIPAVTLLGKTVGGLGAAFVAMQTVATRTLAAVSSAVFSLKAALLTLGVFTVAKSFISAASSAEKFQTRLRIVLGDVGAANQLFGDMAVLASKVSYEYEEIMESATNLSAVMSNGADGVRELMPVILDLAAATGLTVQETTSNMIKFWSAGAGAADMFRERGVLAMLGFKAGVAVSVDESRKKLMDAWNDPESKFRDAALGMADTWEGLMSMLSDQWFMFRTQLMSEGLFDYLKASAMSALDLITGRLDDNKTAMKDWSDDGISAVQGVTTAFFYSAKAVEGLSIGIRLLSNSWRALSTMANPLVGAFVANSMDNEIEKSVELQEQLRTAQKEVTRLQEKQASGAKMTPVDTRWLASGRELVKKLTEDLSASSAAISRHQETLSSLNTGDAREQMKALDEDWKSLQGDFSGLWNTEQLDKFTASVQANFEKMRAEREKNNKAKTGKLTLDVETPTFNEEEMKKWESLQQTFDVTGTAAREYAEGLAMITRAYDSGKISAETFEEMQSNLKATFDDAIASTKELSKPAQEVKKNWEALRKEFDFGAQAVAVYGDSMKNLGQALEAGIVGGEDFAKMQAKIRGTYIEAINAADQLTSSQSEFLSLMRETDTPIERYSRGVADLNTEKRRLIATGEDEVLVNERIGRALKKRTDEYEQTKGMSINLQDAGVQLGLTFNSACEDAVISGGDLSSILDGLMEDVLRLTMRMLILQPLLASIGSSLEGMSASRGDFGSWLMDLFGAGVKGAVSGAATGGSGGTIENPVYWQDHLSTASGGSRRKAQLLLVGEDGPEFFVPKQDGFVMNAADSRNLSRALEHPHAAASTLSASTPSTVTAFGGASKQADRISAPQVQTIKLQIAQARPTSVKEQMTDKSAITSAREKEVITTSRVLSRMDKLVERTATDMQARPTSVKEQMKTVTLSERSTDKSAITSAREKEVITTSRALSRMDKLVERTATDKQVSSTVRESVKETRDDQPARLSKDIMKVVSSSTQARAKDGVSREAAAKPATINVHNYSGKDATAMTGKAPDGSVIHDIVIGAATDSIRKRGDLYKAMRNSGSLLSR